MVFRAWCGGIRFFPAPARYRYCGRILFQTVGAAIGRPYLLPTGEGGTAQAVTDEGGLSVDLDCIKSNRGSAPHQSKIKDFCQLPPRGEALVRRVLACAFGDTSPFLIRLA